MIHEREKCDVICAKCGYLLSDKESIYEVLIAEIMSRVCKECYDDATEGKKKLQCDVCHEIFKGPLDTDPTKIVVCPKCVAKSSGTKHDQGKLRFDLIPVGALEEVAKVYTFGATKYGDNNWRKGLKYSRLYAAALRHLFAWAKGESHDAETKCHHLASVIFCCLAIIQFDLEGKSELDDRTA